MEFPNDPVPYAVLVSHVNELHLHSPIQLPLETELIGNCTIFAVGLTTGLSKPYFPNGSPLAGQVPHNIHSSAHTHTGIITPPDRVELSLGCVQHQFDSLEQIVAHVNDPKNNVVVATVGGAGHAFNVVRTDQGTKIADAQYGFICDLDDWESILKIASGIQDRSIEGNFSMMNVTEHDATFARHLANLDKCMAQFSTHPVVAEKMDSSGMQLHLDQHDTAGAILSHVTDPDVVNSISSFDSIGFRYTQDEDHPNQSMCIEINTTELELKPGDWIAARDSMGDPIILLGAKKGICEMRLDPYKATLTDRDINEDLRVIASSASLDLRRCERTPYSITPPNISKEINFER